MDEKGKNILNEAINVLPPRVAPSHLWENISEVIPKEGLEKSVITLEERKAPHEIWAKIDNELANSSILRQAIDALPEKTHRKDLFFEVTKSKNSSPTNNVKWFYGIAASLTLLIAALVFINNPSNSSSLSYSEEIVLANVSSVDLFTEEGQDDGVLSFIESNCQAVALKCESEEFQGLFDLYLELEHTYEELKLEALENSDELHLANYLVAVEKERTEIGKQLIYLIMS